MSEKHKDIKLWR